MLRDGNIDEDRMIIRRYYLKQRMDSNPFYFYGRVTNHTLIDKKQKFSS